MPIHRPVGPAIPLPPGSTTLTRTMNGWRVCRVIETSEPGVHTYEEYVFQDPEHMRMPGAGQANVEELVSLLAAVRELVGCDYLQSKHRAGLHIGLVPSRTYVETEGDST